jgi:hypothetical protein
MNTNAQTITKFYTAFSALDWATMASCYAQNASFEDPAFSLQGRAQTGGMWRMLCSATQEKGMAHWKLEFSDVWTDATTGKAHWEAHYLFSATGRRVHNLIDAEFTFDKKGLILTHRDTFSFWNWSRQALGAPGLLLGWTPFLRSKVRAQAGSNLKRFLTKKT